jgi:hypothetical protein
MEGDTKSPGSLYFPPRWNSGEKWDRSGEAHSTVSEVTPGLEYTVCNLEASYLVVCLTQFLWG